MEISNVQGLALTKSKVMCFDSYCGHRRKIIHTFDCGATFVRQVSSTEIDNHWEEEVTPFSGEAGYVVYYSGFNYSQAEAWWIDPSGNWNHSDCIANIPDGLFKTWLKAEGVGLFCQDHNL